MNVSWQSKCMALLKAMPSTQAWTTGTTEIYRMVLDKTGEEFGMKAVQQCVLSESWRPAPAVLLTVAAEIASPLPDSEQVYSEIMHLAQTVGLHGVPVAGRPHLYLTGPPQFSHPVVEQCVLYCGGWEAICTGEAQMQEGLKKQVRSAHHSLAGKWVNAVKAQLALPPMQRDRKLFPRWKPYALPAGWSEEALAIAPPIPEYEDAVPIPPELKEMIRKIGKSMEGSHE